MIAQFLGLAAELCQDIEAALSVYSISLQHPFLHGVGSKGQNFILNVVMLHIKLKVKKYRPACKQSL